MRIAMVIVVLAAVGCVSRQPALAKTAVPSPKFGYVGALSTKDVHGGFGLGICDTKMHDYVFSLGDTFPTGDAVGMIALPPGVYHLCYWVTWYLGGEQESIQAIPQDDQVATPFTVVAGHVTLLGSWYVTREASGRTVTQRIRLVPIAESDAVAAIRTAYAGFATAPADCFLCFHPEGLHVRDSEIGSILRSLHQQPASASSDAPK